MRGDGVGRWREGEFGVGSGGEGGGRAGGKWWR